MRILLTGATGFVGRHLVKVLLAQGHELVCAVRGAGSGADPRLSFIHADFSQDTDKSAWRARLAGIDLVINTVGIMRETAHQKFAQVHAAAPCALFAACADAGVGAVIQLSALGADSAATSAYHLSKKAADDCLARLPLASCIVQPSLIYGADGASARLLKAMASMPFALRFGRAAQLVQPIHIDDVVAAIAALVRETPAASGTRHIALVGPEPLGFTGYLAALRRAMGMGRLAVVTVPPALARALARLAGLLPGSLFDADALAMLARGNTADPQATARLLGHAPRSVDSFIADPAAERARARLDWLLPMLRASIALVWIATAIVSAGLYPVDQSLQLLERTGVPTGLGPLMLYGAAGLDLALGVGILVLRGRRRRWLWLAQIALIGFYSLLIAWRLPEFLLHPYGPLTKNLPMLAAIWLLYAFEEE